MSLSLIARADDGGLGVQTWELARHLHPDRVLVIDSTAAGRGAFHPERFEAEGTEVRCAPYPPPPTGRDLAWLAETGHVLTVEGFYSDAAPAVLHRLGAKATVMANPELFPPSWRRLASSRVLNVLAPTTWELERLGSARPFPMPVDRARLPFEERTSARTFLHVSAPAMLDRNGTDVVYEMISKWLGAPSITLLVAGPERPVETVRDVGPGKHTVVPVDHVEDYWRLYDDADVLLVPRRYGGLSLVMQEAASRGLPVVRLDRAPESAWFPACTTIPVRSVESHPMKGGAFDVADASALDLAVVVCALARGGEDADGIDVGACSRASNAFATSIDWSTLGPRWPAVLENI